MSYTSNPTSEALPFLPGHPAYTWEPGLGKEHFKTWFKGNGFAIKEYPKWFSWLVSKFGGLSATTTCWKVLYVRRGSLDESGLEPLYAHEATHVMDMLAYKYGPWIWGLWYMLIPYFRRIAEFRAEIFETAVRGKSVGADVTSKNALRHHIAAASLGGWKWPHFTGGNHDLLLDGVAEMASYVYPVIEGDSSV